MSGCEWVVEAYECDPSALSNPQTLRGLFEYLIEELDLNLVGESHWHQFVGGGMTGLALLQESHLACHTFPEHRSLCLNLFCCRSRPDWDFESCLKEKVGAGSVQVRRLERQY